MRPRVLVLATWFPYPPDNGSRQRLWALVSGLGERYEVDLLGIVDEAVERLVADRGYDAVVVSQIHVARYALGLAEAERDTMVYAGAPTFGATVVDLMQDPPRRDALAAAGRRAVEDRYDWRPIARRFTDLVAG